MCIRDRCNAMPGRQLRADINDLSHTNNCLFTRGAAYQVTSLYFYFFAKIFAVPFTCLYRYWLVGPIPWGHAVPSVTRCCCCRCCCGHRLYIAIHQVSLLSQAVCAIAIAGFGSSCLGVVSTVATPGEWQCRIRTGGVRRLAVANGPNIFQMFLVL